MLIAIVMVAYRSWIGVRQMIRKVHLQANKGEARAPFSFCASRINGKGRVEFNGRQSYAYMSSAIVRTKTFIETPAADRCAHCVDVLRQRQDRYPLTFAAVCEPINS